MASSTNVFASQLFPARVDLILLHLLHQRLKKLSLLLLLDIFLLLQLQDLLLDGSDVGALLVEGHVVAALGRGLEVAALADEVLNRVQVQRRIVRCHFLSFVLLFLNVFLDVDVLGDVDLGVVVVDYRDLLRRRV